jgi:hypothetical protein
MALTYTEAQAISTDYFDKTLTQTVYEDSVVFWTANKNKKVVADGGIACKWPIRYRKLGQSDAQSARDQIIYESRTTRTTAELAWKYYVAKTALHWDEKVQNQGKEAIIKLIADRTEELRQDMFDKFVTDIYSTSQGTLNMQSLDTIVDSATTYAGVAVADVASWAANEDGTTTRVALYGDQSIAELINASKFGKDGVSLIVTTRDLQSKVESLLQGQQVYDTDLAKAGFDNVKFHNVPVVGDYACPSGYMWGLDMNNIEFWYMKGYNFKTTDWFPLEQAGFPEAMAKATTWVGEIVCRQRQTNFKFSALDFTL